MTWKDVIVKRGTFFSGKTGLIKALQRDNIKFLSLRSDHKSIHCIWKFAGNVFMSTKNGVTSVPKNYLFFLQSWNLFLNSLIKTANSIQPCFLFTGLCLADVSKGIQLFAITWVSTALCPMPMFQPRPIWSCQFIEVLNCQSFQYETCSWSIIWSVLEQ